MELTSPAPWLRFACSQRTGTRNYAYEFALSEPWTVIFGASGSGKTTLLRLIAGLDAQGSGTCTIDEQELRSVSAHQRGVVLVDQAATLFPNRTVRQNLAFAASRSFGHTIGEEIDRALDRFGIAELAGAKPSRLSGGESQRVAIARAVLSLPRVLLLDESFSGMDRSVRDQLRAELLKEQAERLEVRAAFQQQFGSRSAASLPPLHIVSVTHDVGEVFATANEVLRIGDGRVLAQGAPGEVLREEREELLRRLGSKT